MLLFFIMQDNIWNSREDLLAEFEDALLKQRSKDVSGFNLKQSEENRLKSQIQHRLKELEALPSSRGEDLQTKCLLELYGLKVNFDFFLYMFNG